MKVQKTMKTGNKVYVGAIPNEFANLMKCPVQKQNCKGGSCPAWRSLRDWKLNIAGEEYSLGRCGLSNADEPTLMLHEDNQVKRFRERATGLMLEKAIEALEFEDEGGDLYVPPFEDGIAVSLIKEVAQDFRGTEVPVSALVAVLGDVDAAVIENVKKVAEAVIEGVTSATDRKVDATDDDLEEAIRELLDETWLDLGLPEGLKELKEQLSDKVFEAMNG